MEYRVHENIGRNMLVAALVVLACVAFLPGVDAHFQLDDLENLAPIQRLVDGAVTWQYAIFSNRSGLFGRPVSMAAFALNAWATGLEAAPFRVVNLALHAICGLLVWRLAEHVLRNDRSLSGSRGWLAPAIAVGWMLLPIHVSTVLYVVQRMAMLSALFTLLALLVYLAGRRRAQAGERGAWILLFVGFPVLTGLAVLSKENGALAPAFALALEIGIHGARASASAPRPRLVKSFFLVFVGLPLLGAIAMLIVRPEFVTGGYADRSFTLWERVLTEPRVLWDYVRGILLPVGSTLGIVQDDYPLSRGLLSPPSTLAAILAWLAVAAIALWQSRRRPALATGVLLFLAGHAMESSILPLEIRFDHRNYLPALGVLLATAGTVSWLLERALARPSPGFRRMGIALLAMIGLAYGFATAARSALWADDAALYRQLAAAKPQSFRLQSILAARAMEAGDLDASLGHIDIAASLNPADPLAPAAWRVLAHCLVSTPPPPGLVERIGEVANVRMSMAAMKGIEMVASRAEVGECTGLAPAELAAALEQVLARTESSPADHGVWRTRYLVARLHGADSRWPQAIAAAEQAWRDSGYNNGVGVLVFQLYGSAGDKEGTRRTLERLRATADPGDLALQSALTQFQQHVDP